MDQKQFDAIKERLENATPGPWEIEPLTGLKTNETTIWMDTDDYLEVHGISIIKSTHNAIFLLNAIEDVPALLAEVEYVREMLRDTRRIVRTKVSEVTTLQNACRKHKQVNQNLFLENERLRVALREVLVNSHDKTFAHTIALQALGGEAND